ncbi:MAG: putative iron-sulfur binding reductase [Promethearchaeota archaeon]|nr:MAG: putative iron-sulfur binding reductase [Candidatus Lokiarchaeota archaeon]
MDEKEILKEINSCIDCNNCLEVCDTFIETGNELQSPKGRLKIGDKAFRNQEISEEERFGLYTCTLCGLCDLVCGQNIDISTIIHQTKIKQAYTSKGLYDIQTKISKGIIEKDNSVNGTPEERLDWLTPELRKTEEFDKKESDTLLFLGCMSSFKVKESAISAYMLLKKADYDFKILKEEPCCGEYLYSTGNFNKAMEYIPKVHKLLKHQGVKRLIVTCAGCLYAFNNVYPKYLDDWNIEVKHIIQVIKELIDEGSLRIAKKHSDQAVLYHDSCRMGRKLRELEIFDQPRSLLIKSGVRIKELNKNCIESPCCGAGSGLRGVDKELCIDIGSKILQEMDDEILVSSCPLCVFNFRYINYKNQGDKKIKYITDFLLDAIEKS